MSKKNKRELVPKLRFPEFHDAGEWKENRLEEIAELYKGKGISKADISPNGAQPCIRYGELYTVYGEVINDVISNTDLTPENLFLSNSGDVIIPSSGETKIDIATAACVVQENIALGGDINVIRSKQNGIFLSYYLNGAFKYEIAKVAQGDTVVHLYKNNLESLDLALPPLPEEQQKIADCLSSLDQLIAAHTKKFEALQSYKKCLMQNLFPAEGKTVPALRFPEFQNAGEWVNPLIEDFFNVGSSKRVLQKDWRTHGVSFYRTRELVSLSKGEPFSSEIFISEELYSNLSEKYGIPSEGDFLVSGVGTLGISYQVQPDDKFYFKDGNVLWLAKKGRINSTYFKYCFESEWIQNQIIGQTSKSTVGTYTIKNAKKTSFWSPPSPEEQQKIADCLSAVDDLIATESQKIEGLKAHKKGLMQQLFPSAEVVDT